MYGWSGFFNTGFWVDPKEELVSVFMSQLFPSDHLRVQEKFRALATQAIVD